MKIFQYNLLATFAVQISMCCVLIKLPYIYPLQTALMDNTDQYDACCAGVGVWSRYVPLSNLIQIGTIGMLDSSCFHIFRIQDKTNNELHFIYYECIDYENKTIKKYFLFFDKEVGDIKEENLIDHTQYEFVWYFEGFYTNPSKQQVIIYLLDGMKQISQKTISLLFPIDKQNFNLIVGGDFIVPQNVPFELFERDILSYFPGEIIYVKNCFPQTTDYFTYIIQEVYNTDCVCEQSLTTIIEDVQITKQSLYEFVSQQSNCQEFLLSGWIKIQEIYSSDDDFDFQFMRLSGNFQHPKLVEQNLCAFQLFYKIQSGQNQIIITTYSYTFPSVDIDFSSNPFLKSEVIDVTSDIKLWHYVLVKKLENSILVAITFYKGFDKEEFNINLDVLQFNRVQFKLLYGNLLQSSSNYLTISIVGFQFFNCLDYDEPTVSCHPTCQECDGPTKDDCLSCFQESNRRYLPDFKQCICEYGTIDMDNQCVNYEFLNLRLNQEKLLKEECKYGFFEFEGDCQKCPSIINKNVITCLECVQNPKQWAQTLICQTTLYTDLDGNVSQKLQDKKQQYTFVGNDLQYCPDCKIAVTPSYDLIENLNQFKDFCITSQSINENCYSCGLKCYSCQILETNLNCLTDQIIPFPEYQTCEPPNYYNFQQNCVACKIKHCLYCFNYFASDPTKTTLGVLDVYSFIDEEIRAGSYSLIDEEIIEGCAQCAQDYIYDFTIGECIIRKPSQQNCLRSYFNFQKQEICTLSINDDFTIALEISNCESHILNCKQCIKTPQSTLKCLLCEDYQMVSTSTGVCSACEKSFSKSCLLENGLDPWKWLVQGFTNQFLPTKPIFSQFIAIPDTLIIECLPGYKKIKNDCFLLCDQMCSECKDSDTGFQCSKCKQNYYQDHIRNQSEGKCFQCSSLCQVCEIRPNEEINKINPYFILTPENIIFTYRCLQQVPLDQIQIDPNLQIAQYCYQNNCDKNLEIFHVNYNLIQDNTNCNTLERINDFLINIYSYQYFNNIGLKEITVTLQLARYCQMQGNHQSLENYYKENIFSLQIVRLKIQGTNLPVVAKMSFTLTILKFDFIVLANLKFSISSLLELIFQNRGNSIDLKIIDTQFYQAKDIAVSLQIQGDSFLNLYLENLLIFDSSIENSVVFNIYCTDFGETIIIDKFKLQNCNFTNSVLFQFKNAQRTIIIKNIIIDSCEFYNSSIARFALNQDQISNVIFNDVKITNSLFQNTSFIYSNERTTFTINNLSIVKNKMMNSKFITFNYESNFQDILIKDNDLISFQFISQISSIYEKQEIQLDQIQIQGNTIHYSQIFVTEQKQSITQTRFLLTNFYFQENIMATYQEYHLIIINCFNLTLQNFFIQNTQNYHFLSLISVPLIKIENVIYENSIQEEKVQLSSECLLKQISHSQLLQVSGFIDITLNLIQIKNVFSIDQSIISIQSNPLIMLNSNEYIKIKNLIVKGNILIKQQLGKLFSIIELQSEKPQIIELDKLSFEENIFHQYNKDPSQTSASLFYVDSGQGILMMKNINCFNNSLTNSSLSYISIFSNEIWIENFQVQNHNYHNQEFWVKYYQIQFQDNYNENEITYIISQSYNIETIGGALSTTVTKFTFNNGFFSFIKTQGSQIFNINLQGDGIVSISDCTINHAHNSLVSIYEQDGAFTISGKKSLLTLYLNNIILTDVLNKLSSSIFSIYPSSSKNNLKLTNIIARDCFSLVDQILNFKSDSHTVLQNDVKIDNFTMIQTEKAFLAYVLSIGKVSLVERQKMLTDNAIMNFARCKLILNQITIDGILLSSIIKIMDSKQIKIANSKFTNIQTFYALNLVDIQQSNDIKSKIHFSNITIQNLLDFNFSSLTQYQFNYNYIHLDSSQCSLQTNQLINHMNQKDLVSTFFEEFVSNSNQNGSLIKLKSITNQTQVLFNKIMLFNNDCQNCWNGLLYLELIDFQKALISELSCIMNYIKNYGCIMAKSDAQIDSTIQIDNSIFISNKGQVGASIFVQNYKFYLKNSILLNNTASQMGGGIYFSEGSSRFTLYSSLIFNNYAAQAGGIYLFGNSSLTKNNFIKSIVIFNFANLSSNNINELPQHLSLQINLIEMFSQQKLIENHLYQVLYLKPYKIISQDHTKSTNVLFIPSGQEIQSYELYNPKQQKYQNYIYDIKILFKNSMNELLINFQNSTCNIEQQTYDASEKSIESIKISKMQFNQDIKGFDLGSLQFDIDPYNQENKIQEILAYCNTSYQDDLLAYRMRVNSFMCQLGEFYIYSGCQICQPLQGFYSVTYNTTKCSIFDKNKFDAITSNKIQLKPGFWRPNQISDDIELCFKNPTYCEGGWTFGNDLCSQGHIGGLCEECDRYNIRGAGSFFKDQKQLECKQCQEFSRLLLTFFLISIWAILSTLLTIRSIEKSNQLFAQLKVRQKFVEILFKLNQDHESILLKLFLNYLWVFSLIFTFNIRFSFSLNFIKQSSDTSYFMANYFECILAEIQGVELIYSRILIMFLLMVAQIIIIYIGFKVVSVITKTKFRMRIISITILYLYIQNYASLINQLFSILAVRKISNLDYISGDVSLIYGTNSHISWIQGFAIPGSTLIGLIIPLLLFLILYLNRKNHNKIIFRRHVGYLFNEYTQYNYFWEMIKLWKKTIIIIILIYFETEIFLKATLLGLCLLFYQLIAQNSKPFILQKLNLLDVQSSQCCSIAIFFATVKYICEQSEQQNSSALIQGFIVITSIILSYPFIINILKVYYKKYRVQGLALLFQGFKSFKHNFKFTKFLGEILAKQRQKEEQTQRNIQKLKSILLRNKSDGQLGINNFGKRNMQKKKQISLILDCNNKV
ncbi:unnamed protein product [Paramecium octaurelia]|uniref:Laminin EGF-like domain-containing protein n=1 Tax=Paramecium octaurelia TaxID=43137 RepID=A0A8S1WM79_PAROT|nr:unnamed protein product [Paramecium octaurelia]